MSMPLSLMQADVAGFVSDQSSDLGDQLATALITSFQWQQNAQSHVVYFIPISVSRQDGMRRCERWRCDKRDERGGEASS